MKLHRKPLRILLAEESSFSQEGIQALTELGQLETTNLTQEELYKRIHNYDVLVLRLGLRADKPLFKDSNQLKVIITPTTGLDHIDLEVAEQEGVAVLSLKGERAFLDQVYSTAEHTFGLLLALLRKIPSSFNAVKGYQWRRDLYRGRELDGKVLGLVGCGRLGTMMVRYATVFGMDVLVYDPYQKQLPEVITLCSSLYDLLSRSDIISLHVPLNEETRGMFSRKEFGWMKPGAYLINTSRGAVIDEYVLLNALISGKLSGAALDVLCDEHLIENNRENPLIEYAKEHDNLIITPHIGGAAYESVRKADMFVIDKLKTWLLENGL